MTNSEQENLSHMTQRDLIIRLDEKVSNIGKLQYDHSMRLMNLELKVREMDTKMKVWSAVTGFIAGIAGSLISLLFNHH